jgi:hypothetical protein
VAGAWFLPYAAGLLAGFVTGAGSWRLRVTLAAVTTAAIVGWGVPLGWPALHGQPSAGPARAVAVLTGRPTSPLAGLAASLLVAVVQALTGAWLGRVFSPRRPDLI